ncbi:MAG TPA: catalase, partial [Tissierellaceae bacterium]
MDRKDNLNNHHLDKFKIDNKNKPITTNAGSNIEDDDLVLKAGLRGPALMQDFNFVKKIMHFTKERIPERVVHARGTGAHGYLEVTNSMEQYTKAVFLQKIGQKTPAFIRISTLQGSKGSADTVRDIRGFALKFYTEDGNYDLTALTFPVFFINDPMKFPDLVHATKPEPRDEIPQAQTAHDNYWDFVSQNHETAHAVMWAMSDRGIPRSYRSMDAFGVNTYKWINEHGKVFFVKYHFKPLIGTYSLLWDEAQKIAGKDPDYHRKDLMDAIKMKNYPQWKFGVQIIPEEDEFMFDFDILDPTKLWPEEVVPVKEVGILTLNKNVDNFFAETEQVAFNPANLIPGIDVSDDPIIQGRMLAYEDTHMHRLGGPNFNQIPINRPINEVNNYERDGFSQMYIHTSPINYTKNSSEDSLYVEHESENAYHFHKEKVEGVKIKGKPRQFYDFYSQASMFYSSLTSIEKEHLIKAFQFELSKVKKENIRQNVVNMFSNVDYYMAEEIANYLGLEIEKDEKIDLEQSITISKAISQNHLPKSPDGLKIAILVTNEKEFESLKNISIYLNSKKIMTEWISNKIGKVNDDILIKESFYTAYPVLYDGIIVGDMTKIEEENIPQFEMFIKETYNHYKPIFYTLDAKYIMEKYIDEPGIGCIDNLKNEEIYNMISQIRFW